MTSGEAAVEQDVRQVYDAHFGRLAGWTTSLIGDRDLAHDVATDAFIKLIKHWDSVQDPRAWLYTAAANQVRDHWRKRGRESAAYDKLTAGQPVDPDVAAPEFDSATRVTVRQAVESLPERFRLAVLLHYYADLSIAQVAIQTGKSEGAVKRDLFDARKQLAAALEGVR
ncbi:RNA polymerase sigma factor [Rudaeicoccus suwonensis]|uniref:RNA polymerase sigma-70 factor (ECF subfamily) n=1 Tax=Rudaeicoccus suwonensis TaxID=657409 RepID=A0A561EBK0_9MICO|nr:RNA polymerase sigma factor [Rudaeicoccus suwonensis]TWE12979.1 RNA polymerase sigma-70 factor (ECF subfamily) [Rudaeicoccus suwonensis]